MKNSEDFFSNGASELANSFQTLSLFKADSFDPLLSNALKRTVGN